MAITSTNPRRDVAALEASLEQVDAKLADNEACRQKLLERLQGLSAHRTNLQASRARLVAQIERRTT